MMAAHHTDEDREKDVAHFRDLGVWPKPGAQASHFAAIDLSTVPVVSPPHGPLPQLRWQGWNSINALGIGGTEALLSIARALPSLRRLTIQFPWLREQPEGYARVKAVEHVLAEPQYPIESLQLIGQIEPHEADYLGLAVANWLTKAHGTLLWSLKGGNENLSKAMKVSNSLRVLQVKMFEDASVSSLLGALEGHPHLEELRIDNFDQTKPKAGLSINICLRGMVSLRRCVLFYIGKSGNIATLDVLDLPKLEYLRLEDCGLVELPNSLLDLPRLKDLLLDHNPLIYPPLSLCLRGWQAVRTYLAMGVASGRKPFKWPRIVMLGDEGGGKSTLLAVLYALQELDQLQPTMKEAETEALVSTLCRRLEGLLGTREYGLARWVSEHSSTPGHLVAAVEAEGGMPLLEARCLAAAAWARHNCTGFWAALIYQGHHVSLAVEQQLLSLGPNVPLVQAVEFASQPDNCYRNSEFFATFGALYVVVCPLVTPTDESNGDVPSGSQWDHLAEDYHYRLRRWLSLISSSPAGQYSVLQESGELPGNILVLTSFAERARRCCGGKAFVGDVAGPTLESKKHLLNAGEVMSIDYGGEDNQALEKLRNLRITIGARLTRLVERDTHPTCFIDLLSYLLETHSQGKHGYLWNLTELHDHLMDKSAWLNSADNANPMQVSDAINIALEFLESTGNVNMLTEEMVLIDPVKTLSTLLCSFVPARQGCTFSHCQELLASEVLSHPGWLRRSVVEEVLKDAMTRLNISCRERGAAAVIEAMLTMGYWYESPSLPTARNSCPDGKARYLFLPARMGSPFPDECLGNVISAFVGRQPIAVCLVLSLAEEPLQTFQPSVLWKLFCWLACQKKAAVDPVECGAFMRNCRGLAHLAAGTSVYVELAEPSRQALFLVCLGPAALETAQLLVGCVREHMIVSGMPKIESLCLECIGELSGGQDALQCGRSASLNLRGGALVVSSWHDKCLAGHTVNRRERIAVPLPLSGGGAVTLKLPMQYGDHQSIEQECEFNEEEYRLNPEGAVYAVLVGVENFGDRHQLNAPCADVDRVQLALQQVYGSRLRPCTKLVSKDNTRVGANNVLNALISAANSAKESPGAQVLFYFAGHVENRDFVAYLVMAHGCADLSLAQVFPVHHQAGVPMIVIIDGCHSGVAMRCSVPQSLKNPMAVPRLTVLCATEEDSEALEVEDEGIFTKCLIQALNGCDGKELHAEEVGWAVEENMKQELRSMKEAGILPEEYVQKPCFRSFPAGSSDDVLRRLCFTFGPARD